MVKFWDSIPDDLRDWALEQQVFFTASAPLAGKHVNISPKGLPSSTFSIFDPNHAAYVDGTGSGSETISHVYENGRITVMFCSFLTAPRILRFFCTGTVIEWDQPRFEPLIRKMGMQRIQGARAVIALDVFKVQTSCGYGVPFLASVPLQQEEKLDSREERKPEPRDSRGERKLELKDRETMDHWASFKIEKNQLHAYQAVWNSSSLDGLTGLRVARRDAGERLWLTDLKARVRRLAAQREALLFGIVIGALWVLALQAVWKRLVGDWELGWGF